MKSRRDFLTFCHICAAGCSRKMTVEDGKIVAIEAEWASGFPTEFCPPAKTLQIMEVCSHPDRLQYPQKRVGARGEGKWQRISWDEALGTIANRLKSLKEKYGPESVAMCLGEPKGMEYAFAQRFATYFGTPNVATPANYCGTPLLLGATNTIGGATVPDDKGTPRLVVMWGMNPIYTSIGLRREALRSALVRGAKLVVVDPKRIDIAKRADMWLRPRPNSDGALALGMLKVIIEEKLYDPDIVANWTVGFDKLAEHVATINLDDVAKLTWVPREQIERFARLYATSKPAMMQLGNGLEQGINSMQTIRALNILRGICGHVNVPGGDIFMTPAAFLRPGRFFLAKEFARKPEKTIGNEFKLAMSSAYVPVQSLVKAILEEKPYPVKAAWVVVSDPLVSYPDSERTYQAFMKLDFLVVNEIFPTPTTALADIVLPAAWGAEYDALAYWPGWYGEMRAHPKVVDPPGEAWPDTKIINEVAKRLGLRKYFWENEADAMDEMLKPGGLTWEQFKSKRLLPSMAEYKKPSDGIFKTPSGKIEIYSQQLEKLGYSPMPLWAELSRFRFEPSAEYPLLMTNRKEEVYMLSGYKHVARARRKKPQPTVEMHPETAAKAGLTEGDWVYIETPRGRIKQQLVLDRDLDPRVVFVSFGWWFPEEPTDLYQFRKSNINVLTDSGPPYETMVGSEELRGVACRVYKA